jgi:HlyD family secretion protein
MTESINIKHLLTPNASKRPWLLWITLILLLIGGLKLILSESKSAPTVTFDTRPLKRGDITLTVTATGKLAPVTQVDIGIEVSGTVADIFADFNDSVKTGQVLAKLDTTKLEAQLKQSQGTLAQAQARLLDAQATVIERQRSLEFLQQAQALSGGQLPAKQELITAQANLKRALAQQALIHGQIFQAEGALKLDQTNLNKASIKTPIDGIVLDRRIEKGQTVAASLQTPLMFTIAKNLTEMELHVDVDEADVGKVNVGQAASFTVDAYPDKHFPATVSQVRYAPQTVGGVVTYETILLVNNADLYLRPGMTATADISIQTAKNVWLVPSAALRFSPEDREKSEEPSFLDKILPRGMKGSYSVKKRGQRNEAKSLITLWILKNNQPQPLPVTLGISDGEFYQISSRRPLSTATAIIVGTVNISSEKK